MDAKKYPTLAKAWDAYGHGVAFKDLHAVKMDRGCYAVLCWKNEDGTLALADMARAQDTDWEMQNDGFSPDISEADWRKLRIIPDCDWFEIPNHPDYQRL